MTLLIQVYLTNNYLDAHNGTFRQYNLFYRCLVLLFAPRSVPDKVLAANPAAEISFKHGPIDPDSPTASEPLRLPRALQPPPSIPLVFVSVLDLDVVSFRHRFHLAQR